VAVHRVKVPYRPPGVKPPIEIPAPLAGDLPVMPGMRLWCPAPPSRSKAHVLTPPPATLRRAVVLVLLLLVAGCLLAGPAAAQTDGDAGLKPGRRLAQARAAIALVQRQLAFLRDARDRLDEGDDPAFLDQRIAALVAENERLTQEYDEAFAATAQTRIDAALDAIMRTFDMDWDEATGLRDRGRAVDDLIDSAETTVAEVARARAPESARPTQAELDVQRAQADLDQVRRELDAATAGGSGHRAYDRVNRYLRFLEEREAQAIEDAKAAWAAARAMAGTDGYAAQEAEAIRLSGLVREWREHVDATWTWAERYFQTVPDSIRKLPEIEARLRARVADAEERLRQAEAALLGTAERPTQADVATAEAEAAALADEAGAAGKAAREADDASVIAAAHLLDLTRRLKDGEDLPKDEVQTALADWIDKAVQFEIAEAKSAAAKRLAELAGRRAAATRRAAEEGQDQASPDTTKDAEDAEANETTEPTEAVKAEEDPAAPADGQQPASASLAGELGAIGGLVPVVPGVVDAGADDQAETPTGPEETEDGQTGVEAMDALPRSGLGGLGCGPGYVLEYCPEPEGTGRDGGTAIQTPPPPQPPPEGFPDEKAEPGRLVTPLAPVKPEQKIFVPPSSQDDAAWVATTERSAFEELLAGEDQAVEPFAGLEGFVLPELSLTPEQAAARVPLTFDAAPSVFGGLEWSGGLDPAARCGSVC
jgi:hypothetical protein